MLLSVGIPVYNAAPFLQRCLSSILSQIDDRVEVICVDDGSTDGSLEILEKMSRRNDRLHVILASHGGVSRARNLILQRAQGTYMAWVDADDSVTEDWYSSLLPLLEQGLDLVFFEHYRVESGISRRMRYQEKAGVLGREQFLYDLVLDTKVRSYLWDKVCKRSLYQGITFPVDVLLMEDYSRLHEICYRARSIYYLNRPLYVYLVRESSLSHTVDFRRYFQAVHIAKDRYDWLKERHIDVPRAGYLKHYLFFVTMAVKENADERWRKEVETCRGEIQRHILYILMSRDITVKDKVKYELITMHALRLIYIWKAMIESGGQTSDWDIKWKGSWSQYIPVHESVPVC